jgi:proteasome lid subunit RPN8/RPN11
MAEGGSAMTVVIHGDSYVEQTLAILRDAGREGVEGMCLWLAPASAVADSVVTEVYRPELIAGRCFFEIPPEAMRCLMRHLAANRLKVAAQVHSHPGRAFHSEDDDKWAIIRHEGGLSIVVPRFALHTTQQSFLSDSAIYQLDQADEWQPVNLLDLPRILRVSPC